MYNLDQKAPLGRDLIVALCADLGQSTTSGVESALNPALRLSKSWSSHLEDRKEKLSQP